MAWVFKADGDNALLYVASGGFAAFNVFAGWAFSVEKTTDEKYTRAADTSERIVSKLGGTETAANKA